MKGHWSFGRDASSLWCLEYEGVCRGAGEVSCAGDGGLECSAKVYGL